mgnify:CR=1 FL=1
MNIVYDYWFEISVIYIITQVIPFIMADIKYNYIKADPIDWILDSSKLREYVFYLRFVYFIPFIAIWLIITQSRKFFKFLIYKK